MIAEQHLPPAYTWDPATGTLTHPAAVNAGQAHTVFTMAARHAATALAHEVAVNPTNYL